MKLTFDNSYARLSDAFYQRVTPMPLSNPYFLSWNQSVAALVDLALTAENQQELLQVFSGAAIPDGADPLAAVYAGHQFGSYVPRLGDGRTILLGEVINRQREKWDVQLKGAGVTRYSRGADGRLLLSSAIREYLGSQALHGLGIASTRALCVVASDESVFRQTAESAAMLVRVASSHVRFGTFEYFAFLKETKCLQELADHVIEQHYPGIGDNDDRYAMLFQHVVNATAELVARWQVVGFAHGVMNTDNMSILGLTLDYGPFGFMEQYAPNFNGNQSDDTGRYAFDRQPRVAFFNLNCLANAFLLLVDEGRLRAMLVGFETVFLDRYYRLMSRKLGIDLSGAKGRNFIDRTLSLLHKHHVDYTNFFRELANVSRTADTAELDKHFTNQLAFYDWLREYQWHCVEEGVVDHARKRCMDQVNPRYILRNYQVQRATEKANARDFAEIEKLVAILGSPFDDHPGCEVYARPSSEAMQSQSDRYSS